MSLNILCQAWVTLARDTTVFDLEIDGLDAVEAKELYRLYIFNSIYTQILIHL